MPFTPSHAVVALAFTRTPLIPAAIAVGAMAPDLPLFTRVGWPSYWMTHDLRWIGLTLVIALVLLLVWRGVLRGAAIDLVPLAIARRLPPEWGRTPRESLRETFARRGDDTIRPSLVGVLLLLASLALGVVSHVVWDLFTHEGRAERWLPVLDTEVGPFALYKWLQHGSSFLGLAILAIWVLVRLSAATPRSVPGRAPTWVRLAVWLSFPAVLVAAAAGAYLVRGPFTQEWTLAHLAYQVGLPACAVWALLFMAAAALLQGRRLRAARRA